MATSLTELIVPTVFDAYVTMESNNLNRLKGSGAVFGDARMRNWMQSGESFIRNMPHYDQLDEDEPRTGTDDPADIATHNVIRTHPEIGVKMSLNKSWASPDLVTYLVGNDPMRAIARLVAAYWARQEQRMLVNFLHGIYLSNVDNNSSDMIHSVALPGVGTPGAANFIDNDAIIATQLTMGDRGNELTMMICHSTVFARLQALNLITFEPFGDQNLMVPTYLGKTVIVDDRVKTFVVSGNVNYVTYFLARNSIMMETAPAKRSTVVDREEAQGNGEGMEILYNRTQKMLHVPGISWNSAALARGGVAYSGAANPTVATVPGGLTGSNGGMPSIVDLAHPDAWLRVVVGPTNTTSDADPLFARKYIKLAFLVTNG